MGLDGGYATDAVQTGDVRHYNKYHRQNMSIMPASRKGYSFERDCASSLCMTEYSMRMTE
jgi:hypothetical protein